MLSFRQEWRVHDFVDEVVIVLRRDLRPEEGRFALDGWMAGRAFDRWFPGWHTDEVFARQALFEIYKATEVVSVHEGGLLGAHFLMERVKSAFEGGRLVAVRVPRPSHATLSAPKEEPAAPVLAAAAPSPLPKELLTLEWSTSNAWCGEAVALRGTTRSYADGETLKLEIKFRDAKPVTTLEAKVNGNAFNMRWTVKDIVPGKVGAHFPDRIELDAFAGGKSATPRLVVHVAPSAPKQKYEKDHARFMLGVEDKTAKLESKIEYVKGWGVRVVKLSAAVKEGTGGEIPGFSMPGYRWMKTNEKGKRQFWNGKSWVDLPTGFAFKDGNNLAVGLYESGAVYKSQYGGEWPDAKRLHEWDITAKASVSKIEKWAKTIHDGWTHVFDLKRQGCPSAAEDCCRYDLLVNVGFTLSDSFASGKIIVADGDIRSNSELWFLGETRERVSAHEFGHHLGNPDEYLGATLETTLNDDGAKGGVDEDSIMGQNLTVVKKRHFRTIVGHLARVVKAATRKSFTFEAVKRS